MKLGKLNVTISKEAVNILKQYQKEKGYSNLDSATDSYIIEKAEND